MTNRLLILPFLIILCVINTLYGQNKKKQLDELLEKYSDYEQFNGSVLVAENGKILYKKGFGLANMEWRIPNESNTKYRLGSITKQFTSMLIMQLVEEGKLKLHDPIINYLPDYPKENGNRITVHHLLTHSSGIPNYTSFPKFIEEISLNPYTPNEFTTVFKDSILNFKPGKKYSYSNSGYFLLGVIIEKITNKKYEEVLHNKIFKPLKMNDSGYDRHKTIIANRATGYENGKNGYINAPYLDMTIPYAAGSLYSSVEDLYLWDQALYNNIILSKENTDLLFTKHVESGNKNRVKDYSGYGWFLVNKKIGKTNDTLNVITHGGGIPGFNSLITRIPNDKHLIVLLNNTGRKDLNKITDNIISILYNTDYELPKKSLVK